MASDKKNMKWKQKDKNKMRIGSKKYGKEIFMSFPSAIIIGRRFRIHVNEFIWCCFLFIEKYLYVICKVDDQKYHVKLTWIFTSSLQIYAVDRDTSKRIYA